MTWKHRSFRGLDDFRSETQTGLCDQSLGPRLLLQIVTSGHTNSAIYSAITNICLHLPSKKQETIYIYICIYIHIYTSESLTFNQMFSSCSANKSVKQ